MPATATMSAKALARLKKPRTRGAFQPVDAARRELGLLSIADGNGQARLSWLIELPTQTIVDGRFLAFGDLSSHPIADAFCELARGRTVPDACRLTAEQIDLVLRDDPSTPAFADLAPYAFIRDLQDRAERELPAIRLLPKPADALRYERKRKADWSPADESWLPLGLLKKATMVDDIANQALGSRIGGAATYRVDAINDDFRVVVRFSGVTDEQVPTLCQFLQDALRGMIHPQLTVVAAV